MNVDEFIAKHGFPGTPAGDRMKADLEQLLADKGVHIIRNAQPMYISLDKEPGPGGGYIESIRPAKEDEI